MTFSIDEYGTVVDAIIVANLDKVAHVQEKPSMLGWFVGQAMKNTDGKANPIILNELFKERFDIV